MNSRNDTLRKGKSSRRSKIISSNNKSNNDRSYRESFDETLAILGPYHRRIFNTKRRNTASYKRYVIFLSSNSY